jgi:hypothetical protein
MASASRFITVLTIGRIRPFMESDFKVFRETKIASPSIDGLS